MDIIFLSTEAVPFAKTGGLGDVCGALPLALAERGHRVTLIMPAFASVYGSGLPIRPTDISFAVVMREAVVGARLLTTELQREGCKPVRVYFIDQPQYYNRPTLYGDAMGDFNDNCERFAFFCRAALQAITRLDRPVDVVHCNDWQSGLVPAYMRIGFESHRWMKRARSVFTIHNLAYQGSFWHWDFPLTGLDWQYFNAEGMEFYGRLNFLKAGIACADMVTTVSPTYAREIQTELHGCGLDPLLQSRADSLRGIINGMDDSVWNPATDGYLRLPHERGLPPVLPPQDAPGAGNYDISCWQAGKALQKRRLQDAFGLVADPALPLIGVVGRLADQKGCDLIIEVLSRHLEEERPVQWIILGTGEKRYHEQLKQLADKHPERFGLYLGFSDELAHQIEAASDLFVMPSRYEPCGLNQLYSLHYGTVPVVTATGGLADTVTDTTPETLAAGTATGFVMDRYGAEALDQAIGRALDLLFHEEKSWKKIVETGMAQDWSWRQSAVRYEKLYAETIALDGPWAEKSSGLARQKAT